MLAEALLRVLWPSELFAGGRDAIGWTENTALFQAWMRVDSELGYVPLPDTDLYDARGLVRDRVQDPQPPPSGPAVLWLGDSVTARRYVEREVRRRSGQAFRSWCGGVEGYNVDQTVGYYRRTLRRLRPDHVVFTLHHNDWSNTPVVFYDDDGRVHCRTFDRDLPSFSPWWFEHSYVYRAVFAWRVQRAAALTEGLATTKVRAALLALRDIVQADALPLDVLVLPPLQAEEPWSEASRLRHAEALTMLREFGIRHVDLLPGLRRALAQGIDPQQVVGDWMHPSEAVAPWLADELLRAGFVAGR